MKGGLGQSVPRAPDIPCQRAFPSFLIFQEGSSPTILKTADGGRNAVGKLCSLFLP